MSATRTPEAGGLEPAAGDLPGREGPPSPGYAATIELLSRWQPDLFADQVVPARCDLATTSGIGAAPDSKIARMLGQRCTWRLYGKPPAETRSPSGAAAPGEGRLAG